MHQTLPWEHRGWHGGGASSNTLIGVEMCEPACIKYVGGANFTCSNLPVAKAAAERTYQAAVEAMSLLSSAARKILEDVYGDLQDCLTTRIEAEIKSQKSAA